MKKKNILIAILICVSGILFLSANSCLARELEITYPDIPGAIRPVSTRALLPETLVYIFNLGISISGIIIFGTIVFGGVKFLTSAGNPVAHSEAMSQIRNAFLGGILVLSSFLLLQNINPQLLSLSIGREIAHQGIILFKDLSACNEFTMDESKYDELVSENRALKITSSISHLRGFLGENYSENIQAVYSFEKPEDLEIQTFNKENWIGSPIIQNIDINNCVWTHAAFASAKSIKLVSKPAGVYLCCGGIYDANWKCQGEEKYLAGTTSALPPECHDKIQGIKFKNLKEFMAKGHPGMPMGEYTEKCREKGGWNAVFDSQENTVYCEYNFAVVLHDNANFKAECEVFTQSIQNLDSDRQYKTITGTGAGANKASSVTVFEPMRPLYAKGAGVTLFPESSWRPVDGGYETLKQKKAPNAQTIGINDHKKVWSIEIAAEKRYIAALFEQRDYGGRCEVFTESDPSFINNDIGNCGCMIGANCHPSVKSLQIYPTR